MKLLIGSFAVLSLVATSHAGMLLMPNSANDSIWTLNAVDGSVVRKDLIVDPTRLVTAIEAVDSGRGTILVSDQSADAVFEYGYDGSYIQTVVSSAQGLDNVRGIEVVNGQLYVTVASGSLSGTIQRFDLNGPLNQTTFFSITSGSPWDVKFDGMNLLVTDSGGDDLYRVGLNGVGSVVYNGNNDDMDFPQQIALLGGGDVTVSAFSSPSGLYRIDTGTGVKEAYANVSLTGFPNIPLRGGHLLGNGKVLWTGGNHFGTWDPNSNAIEGIVVNDFYAGTSASSFRFVNYTPVPEPATLAVLGLGLLALRRRLR